MPRPPPPVAPPIPAAPPMFAPPVPVGMGRQMWNVVSQMLPIMQSAFAVHWTQVPFGSRQCVPVLDIAQFASLVHCTHTIRVVEQ